MVLNAIFFFLPFLIWFISICSVISFAVNLDCHSHGGALEKTAQGPKQKASSGKTRQMKVSIFLGLSESFAHHLIQFNFIRPGTGHQRLFLGKLGQHLFFCDELE